MTEIAIIGAGVIGCAAAYELAKRGARPTVVDREGDVGHGTTAASCGIVRRFYSTIAMAAMAQESAEVWAEWPAYLDFQGRSDLARFLRPGMLFIPPAIDAEIERIVAHTRELGVPVEVLSREEVARRFPFLDTRSHQPVRRPEDPDFFDDSGSPIAGALFEPDSGYVVSPLGSTKDLRAAGEREGVRFILGRGVRAIHDGEGPRRFRLELEDDSELSADVVVNAAGPHSAIINELASVRLPLETRPLVREVSVVANPLDAAGESDALPIIADVDSGVYLRPESGGRDLLVGSLDPPCDPPSWVAHPDDCDGVLSAETHERQMLRAMKRVPELRLGARRGLASLYDVTLLDWNPIVDRTDRAGYYVAMGTSGSSFKTAPVIGALLAELIDACEGGLDHDRDPLRVGLPRTGFEVDVSFFSRLRGAHASTGTVLG